MLPLTLNSISKCESCLAYSNEPIQMILFSMLYDIDNGNIIIQNSKLLNCLFGILESHFSLFNIIVLRCIKIKAHFKRTIND